MNNNINDTYFKIRPDRRDYKGERYFRFNPYSDHVLQVVVFPGEEKRGRNATNGVYQIHRLTFLSNYLSPGYAIPSSKKEFGKQFDKMVELLK